MIMPGDKIMIGTLGEIAYAQRFNASATIAPIDFELLIVHVDTGAQALIFTS